METFIDAIFSMGLGFCIANFWFDDGLDTCELFKFFGVIIFGIACVGKILLWTGK